MRSRRVMMLACVLAIASVRPSSSDEASVRAEIADMDAPARVAYLSQSIAEGSRDPAVHFYLGNAYYAVQQMDSAVAHLGRATELDPGYAKAWVNLGTTYEVMGQQRNARMAYQHALEADPYDVLANCHLGFMEFNEGQVDRAVERYVRALERDPDSAQARYNLGLAFAEARMFNEALREWNRVIELDPDGELGRVARENVGLIQKHLDKNK